MIYIYRERYARTFLTLGLPRKCARATARARVSPPQNEKWPQVESHKRWLKHENTPHILSCSDCNNVSSPSVSSSAHHLLINRLSEAREKGREGKRREGGQTAAAFLLWGHVEICPLLPNKWSRLNQTFTAANNGLPVRRRGCVLAVWETLRGRRE